MRAAMTLVGILTGAVLVATGVASAQSSRPKSAGSTPEAVSREAQWQPLFNGKDLTGWEHVGPGAFTIEDGQLKGQGGMGLLWYTGKKLGDAVIRVVYIGLQNHSDQDVVYFKEVSVRPLKAARNSSQ